MRFLTDDRVVDTGTNKRSMQVIAAGLPRCATSSIQAALESPHLDCGPSMHMAHIYPWPSRSQIVLDAMREPDREKRQKLLRNLTDGYSASCDFPGVVFVEDLMDMYPEAAIILNQRESAEVWAKSLGDALMFFNSWTYTIVTLLWRTDRLHWKMQMEAFRCFSRTLGMELRPSARKGAAMWTEWYVAYNEHVRKAAAARGRPVLEWTPKDGWEPMCKFLGKPVPAADVPFPRMNDQAEMRMLRIILTARGLVSWVALGGGIWAAAKYGPGLMAKVVDRYFS